MRTGGEACGRALRMWGSGRRVAGDVDVDGEGCGSRALAGRLAGWPDGEAPLPPFSDCGLDVSPSNTRAYESRRRDAVWFLVWAWMQTSMVQRLPYACTAVHSQQAGSIRMSRSRRSTACRASSTQTVQKAYGDQLMLKGIADCAPCLRCVNARRYVPCQTAAGVPVHCPASYLADPDAIRTYPAYGCAACPTVAIVQNVCARARASVVADSRRCIHVCSCAEARGLRTLSMTLAGHLSGLQPICGVIPCSVPASEEWYVLGLLRPHRNFAPKKSGGRVPRRRFCVLRVNLLNGILYKAHCLPYAVV